ncbi:hypothetical protein [Moraxella sp. ZY200743]|uniref:hypothetical protein n=1 Tax=Moraxella sp. ZY200743 TaxID=2911970 RepID=UPI003D7CDCD0
MKHTEWENKLKELSQIADTKALFESNLGVNTIDIYRLALVFFADTPLPADHQTQFDKCISDIISICTDVIMEVIINSGGNFTYALLVSYFNKNTLFSTALDNFFASFEQSSLHTPPTPAIRQKVVELIALSLTLKHLASFLYQNGNAFYAMALANKSLEVLGGAKYLYGLPQDTILKFELLSDDDKTAIHKQIQREQGKQHALKATEHKRQERARLEKKYLNIMTKQGFTSYAETVRHIFQYDNQENKNYEWIESVLKQADKDRKEHSTTQIE